MRWLSRLQMRVRMLFRRGAAGAQLDDELSFHVEQQIAANIALGMNAEEAHYAALRSFGNPALLGEQTRAWWNWNRIESFAKDGRLIALSIWRRPGFPLTSCFSLDWSSAWCSRSPQGSWWPSSSSASPRMTVGRWWLLLLYLWSPVCWLHIFPRGARPIPIPWKLSGRSSYFLGTGNRN